MAIRTYGLSGSGMDVDQLVKGLMKARQVPYDNMFKKKTQFEWKKADYNTMYNTISDFRNTVFTNKLQATLTPKEASSADESIVSATALADAVNTTHTITVAQLADGVKKSSSDDITPVGNSKTTLATQFGLAGSFDVKVINGDESATITVDTSQSIYEFVSSINEAGINVTASYDATLDRFFLNTNDSGSTSGIDFTGSDVAGLDFLSNNLLLNTATENGKDAEIALDGVGTGVIGGVGNLKLSTNKFTISSVTYNLKTTGTTTVSVAPDIDKLVDNVEAFITSYNSTLATINGELNETRNRNYLPLTDDEKSAMKDSDIVAWETKAKSGMLQRDSILSNLVNTMRNNISNPVSGLTGSYNNASSIGITTGNYTEGGKLYIDENKLRTALQSDPNIVYKIFGTDGDNSSEDGISIRLYDTLKGSMDKIVSEAGITATVDEDVKSNLAKRINNYSEQMEDLVSRLKDVEDRYYKQFDAMETALSRLSQQSNWLAQQFA